MSQEKILLQLNEINKQFISPTGDESPNVLKDINLQVNTGDSIAIIGPSGSGKSTLLNIMGTLDKPTSGKVILEDQDLTQCDDKQLAAIRNQKIGFIFQLHHLLPQCTVLENVLIPTLACSKIIDTQKVEAKAKQLLDRVGLSHRLSYCPGQLSGGERQRAAVVRALINEPKLLLADEPTGSLDQDASTNLTKLLTELNEEEKVALIVVTHSAELANQMKKSFKLSDGKLEVS